MAQSFRTVDHIAGAIHTVRGHRVMLDTDLAALYRVPTKRLNEQVKRNRRRFPADFAFRLTVAEAVALRSQSATSNTGRGGRRYAPLVFTEHGALMLASVLNSAVAIQASIQIVRAFTRLRQMLVSSADLAHKIDALEKRYDRQFGVVFRAIRRLMEQGPGSELPRIGFRAGGAPRRLTARSGTRSP